MLLNDGTITAQHVLQVRQVMESTKGWDDQIAWSEGLGRVTDPELIARELIFVICNSGMHRKVARMIFEKIMVALSAGGSACDVFRHAGKAGAIDQIWRRQMEIASEIAPLDDEQLLDWCGNQPWIGKITKYHAAKNLGADVAKPDRHLDRLAQASGETVEGLCARLSSDTGLRVATIDLILWWGAAEGYLKAGAKSDNTK